MIESTSLPDSNKISFDAIKIGVGVSGKDQCVVKRRSQESQKTINYRTLKPEKDGLFL
jgi:hypothetical protein